MPDFNAGGRGSWSRKFLGKSPFNKNTGGEKSDTTKIPDKLPIGWDERMYDDLVARNNPKVGTKVLPENTDTTKTVKPPPNWDKNPGFGKWKQPMKK
jgi:hypothetical protein